jgi:hypothetical protein
MTELVLYFNALFKINKVARNKLVLGYFNQKIMDKESEEKL